MAPALSPATAATSTATGGALTGGASNDNAPLAQATTLAVPGMYCGACMVTVEQALRAVPGVTAARANLSARRATAVHAGAAVKADDLVAALAGVGYKAAEIVDHGMDPAREAERDLLRRLGVAGFAAANIMLLSVSVWSGAASDMEHSIQALFHWLSAMIALPAVAFAGQPFFRSAAAALGARRLNMDVPISLGVVLATAMSLFQTSRGSEQVYFDAAVSLLFFLLIGRFLDSRMRVQAQGAAANLLGLQAITASVIRGGGRIERIAARHLVAGQSVLVAAGERVPADGIVRVGLSDVDESLLTGETVPKSVGEGDLVSAGTINLSGALTVETVATDSRTRLAEIARLMEAAEQGRGRFVRLADRAARIYAPGVHLLGLLTFLGWLLAGHGWEPALTATIAVLIITCPCALALAVPAVQVAATSRLFAKGVLVKSADGLERLAECDTVVLDKTGTLTLGEPQFLGIGTGGDDATLERAAALAATSRHPYARAAVKAAERRGLRVTAAAGAVETPGAGLAAPRPDGEDRLGSPGWCGLSALEGDQAPLWFRPAGGQAVPLRFEDAVRPDAAAVVGELATAGFRVELLSGDRPEAVAATAAAVGLREARARASPADKIARLEALKAEGRRVLMVGDGLNDAPALAAGHASLSPASAADISQTTADAVFQGASLKPVVELIMVARAAHRMALQNFAIAIGYNLLFVPLAVAGLVTPLIAAVAMSASSIAVTANAVRLGRAKLTL